MSSAAEIVSARPLQEAEKAANQERRIRFLRYASRGWLIFGLLTLVFLPLFPAIRGQSVFLAVAVLPSYLVVHSLERLGKIRAAGILFTVVVDYGFYGLFLLLSWQQGPVRAFATEATIWMLMGLAVVLAGALIQRWAAPVTALVNTVILIVTRLLLAPGGDPRPSIVVFWWTLALIIWLYETSLEESLAQTWKELADREHAEEQLIGSEQRLRSLSRIEQALSETERVGVETILQLIVDSAKDLIPKADYAVLHLIDLNGEFLQPRAVAGPPGPNKGPLRMRVGEGIAGLVIQTRKVIDVADASTDARVLGGSSSLPFRSMIVAPIQSNERCFGTISIQSSEVAAFSSIQSELLGALGTQAAIAIENTNLLETTQQSLKESNALYRISRSLATSLDPDELMDDVVELLHRDFGFYHVQIYELDLQTRELVASHGSGAIGEQLRQQGYRLPVGSGIVGHTADVGEAFTANNVENVIFFLRNPLLPDTQSEMAIPIKIDNEVVGVLDIQQTLPSRLTERQMQLMQAVAEHLAVALDKARLYANLQKSLRQEKTVRAQLIHSERLAVVGRLLASVSHELNNPIQAIQNALFLIKEGEHLTEQGHQDLGIVISETERMSALINRLRAAYRPTNREDLHEVDLNRVVDDVRVLTATHMRRQDVKFDFIRDANLPRVWGIPDQLKQVILNLFMNAIEAMPNGGCLAISTAKQPGQELVHITFSDTGQGIEPELLPHIFEPFVSNKDTGTGLGLTITYDIVQQHGGRIQAENKAEGGATFTVSLPVNRKA